jgi:putative nucleotidyltransferase with HDIG domain
MSGIKIPLDRIQVGLHVKLPLKWMEHPFLFNEFKIKDAQQLNLIRNMGVKYVYVNPSKSKASILPPNVSLFKPLKMEESQELDKIAKSLWEEKQKRIKKQKAYKRKIQRCENNYNNSMSQLRSILSTINSRPLDAVEGAGLLVDSMVETLLAEDNVTLHLMNNTKERDEIYSHSLNVTVLSMLVAKAARMSGKEIKTLAMSALFHDMGKLKLPSSIIRKTTPLTKPEENYFKLHTQYSLEMAKTVDGFSPTVKTVVYQHHECIDGSGYPRQLTGKNIHPLAQLIAVTDQFDRLCHPQNPAETRSPHESLSFLFKAKSKQFNNNYMALLAKSVGIYPPGSIVQLSDQQIGIVISVNINQSLSPSVLLYNPAIPSDQALIIDLAESPLKIVGMVPREKLSQEMVNYLNPSDSNLYYLDSDK